VLLDQIGNTWRRQQTGAATVDTLAGATGAAPTVTITEDATTTASLRHGIVRQYRCQRRLPAGSVGRPHPGQRRHTITNLVLTDGHHERQRSTSFVSPGEATPSPSAPCCSTRSEHLGAGQRPRHRGHPAGAPGAAPTVDQHEDAKTTASLTPRNCPAISMSARLRRAAWRATHPGQRRHHHH